MRYLIEHETVVRFPIPVRDHRCEVRLTPLDRDQRCRRLAVTTRPAALSHTRRDAFGNAVTCFSVHGALRTLSIRLEAEVETALENPFAFQLLAPAAERVWLARQLAADPALSELVRHRSPFTEDPAELVPGLELPAWDAGAGLLEAVLAASAWVGNELRYASSATPAPSLARVIEQGGGDCWDFAHLLIAVVRGWGVPARLVTGYLDSGYDSGATPCRFGVHAWADVLVPGGGWRGIDPVLGLVANDTYVALAVGRDGLDVPPWCDIRTEDAPGGSPELGIHRVRQI